MEKSLEKKKRLCIFAGKKEFYGMRKERTLISFDWALKRLLRDKANFDVLEGFLSTLLQADIKIQKILESESNKDCEDSKMNRVDILAEDSQGELLLVEVQGESEYAYFQRILFGASKLVTEYIDSGQNYDNVKKVYSINIVYFDLGQGKDFVYHGKTEFRGIHNDEVLKLSTFQRQQFGVDEVYKLYPEYYILKVNDFNHWSKVPLEQWIYFLSTSEIPDDADAPGLKAAREKLRISQMSKEEQAAYRRYLDNRVILADQIFTAKSEGRLEGLAEGREEGREEGRAEGRAEGERNKTIAIAWNLKQMGIPLQQIVDATGLSPEDIAKIKHVVSDHVKK